MPSLRVTVRKFTLSLFFTIVLIFTLHLIISLPNYRKKPCPLPLSDGSDDLLCNDIMESRPSIIEYVSQFAWCKRHDEIALDQYLTEDCVTLRTRGRYANYKVTSEEEEFPIAFSILTHENMEQTERLLRLIYRPHNAYCIHVDAKSSSSMHHAAKKIASCLNNVFIAPHTVNVHWGEFSLLEAELVCLRALYDGPVRWKYYMNLMSREFPLKTNRELVNIFRTYNGANDVDGTLHRRPILWTTFVWKNENWRTSELKSPAPHKFNIGKGSAHIAASRAFIDYALNSQEARDLLDWMRDIRAPDEHFFPTLNHNPHLGIPGAYKGDPDLKWFYARLKIWQSPTDVCHGQWVRYICNLGVGDLARLRTAPHLFVNKIRLEQDPTAYTCLERWYRNRTRTEALVSALNDTYTEEEYRTLLNVSFYANLPFVVNHV